MNAKEAAFIACAAITVLSSFTSLGFSVASLRAANGQAQPLALYACARSIAFATLSLASIATGPSGWLKPIAVGMIMVQFLDACIGIMIGNRLKALGPALTAAVNLTALIWWMNA